MKCEYAKLFLYDYVDKYLAQEQINIIEPHIDQCEECLNKVALYKRQKLSLKQLETPKLDLQTSEIAQRISKSHAQKSLMAYRVPFALAASLVLVISFAGSMVFFKDADIIGEPIVSSYHVEKTINLVFTSPKLLDRVTFTVILPDNIELVGHPGEKEVIWVARLDEGKNILSLPIISKKDTINKLIIAKINYENNSKIFKINLNPKNIT